MVIRTIAAATCVALAVGGSAFAGEHADQAGKEIGVHSKETAAIFAAATGLVKAWRAKDAKGVASHFADDATAMEPEVPVMTGADALGAYVSEAVKDPNFSLDMTLNKVDAVNGGNLGYVRGKFSLTYTGQNGTLAKNAGNFIAIFKKQADGSWKVVEDISSVSPE